MSFFFILYLTDLKETNDELSKHMGTLKVIYWNLMSMHRRRETSRKETYDKDIVEKAINDNKKSDEINVDETLVVRSPRHVKQKDHGMSDISLLRTLRHLDLLPEAYLENRQGHLLINLCKGVASMEFANDRLCFIEFVQFICRVHLERLHIKEGGGQTVQKQTSIHDHIVSNHGENIQLMKHHNKQVDLLKEIPSFIVYGSHIVDGAYHNIIKPKNFALTLKETIEKFASV